MIKKFYKPTDNSRFVIDSNLKTVKVVEEKASLPTNYHLQEGYQSGNFMHNSINNNVSN